MQTTSAITRLTPVDISDWAELIKDRKRRLSRSTQITDMPRDARATAFSTKSTSGVEHRVMGEAQLSRPPPQLVRSRVGSGTEQRLASRGILSR